MGLQQYDAAVQEGLKALDSGYRNTVGYTSLAAFYAAADRVPEAKAALAEAMKLNPNLSLAWFHAHMPSYIDSPPGFSDSLKKAGLPDE
jgi:tetratricopeptide (TPR) repeat protein